LSSVVLGLRIDVRKWATIARRREAGQTWSFRGSKSRNKVSVGEPAEGSLTSKVLRDFLIQTPVKINFCFGNLIIPNNQNH
jgi:hypothetical protein